MKTNGYDIAREHLLRHRNTIEVLGGNDFSEVIKEIGVLCVEALKNGKKLMFMGNGGSAADAQHFAAELVGRYLVNRRPLSALALTVDTSILTAVSNDYSFENVFSRQIEALGKEGDVVLGFSTSGRSKNIIIGLQKAREMKLKTVTFTGKYVDEVKEYSDSVLAVPSEFTPVIQEIHIMSVHIICNIIELSMD